MLTARQVSYWAHRLKSLPTPGKIASNNTDGQPVAIIKTVGRPVQLWVVPA